MLPSAQTLSTPTNHQSQGKRKACDTLVARPRIPDSARAVLEGPALAHLVTLEPDGRPQVSIVWIGLDGDELVAGHLPEHRKVRNIRQDPRVALSIEAGTRNEMGLDEYIVIHAPPGFITHITVERIGGVGPWAV